MLILLKQTICASFVVTALLLPITSQAATYYVAPTGNDASTCTQAKSASTPKKTIPAGVKCLAGGDTLIVKAGTYINQEITNPPAGTASTYTVIKGDPSGPRPVILPSRASYQRGFYCSRGETCRYIEMRHFEVRDGHNAVKLYGNDTIGYAHHLRFINNYFYGGGVGMLIDTSTTGFRGGDHLIQGNEFHKIGRLAPGYTPGVNAIYNPGNRSIIERNKFHNLAHGVGIYYGNRLIHNVIIRNNTFYDIGLENTDTWQRGQNNSTGIHVSSGGGGHLIYNNLIYRSGDKMTFRGILINPYSNATQTTMTKVYNNTIHDLKNTSGIGIHVAATTGGPYLIKNNIVYKAGLGVRGGIQSNNMTSNPSFKNSTSGDFQLLSGSLAINKGVILPEVPTDFSGARRPAGTSHDIGAYEAGATSTLAAPTSLSVQ